VPATPDRPTGSSCPSASANPARVDASFPDARSRPFVAARHVVSTSTPVISKRAPPSSLSVASISQSWASAIRETIARPNPVPSAAVETPYSKTASRFSAGIPGPSSAR
jgi:hypothetical protein